MGRTIRSWLMDMDGVLVREEHAIPGANEFLSRLQQLDAPFLVLTNNSMYTRRDLAARLRGSGTLVRAMLADGLVDEVHLLVYPLTRGSGPRLFPDGAAPGNLALAACRAFENGVVYMAYRPKA